MTEAQPQGLAAIDLGSNSFRMLLAQLVGGEPVVVDRIREQVQLAAGLDAQGCLSEAATERALACLDRFGQRLRHKPGLKVRAVATNTLRVAANATDFLRRAADVLGHRIEVISGQEEARLIYLGIAHTLADDQGSRLVVDIGGGSTECILGETFEPLEAHSLYMGCVRWTQRFFDDGVITKARMREGHLAASRELLTLSATLRGIGWDDAVGSSGTIRACEAILQETGWCEQGIDQRGLSELTRALIKAGHAEALDLPGLKPERRTIIAGGVSILSAVFESLGIDHMQVTQGSLREGVLYDLLGRIRHEDVRERTIRVFQERYGIDPVQAARVERTALSLLLLVAEAWDLAEPRHARFLGWAARLHEVGLAMAYRHHHRHGAYVLSHSDMPGFSRDDQVLLAAIVGHQRRKFGPSPFEDIESPQRRQLARRLTVLLRLALLANRGRSPRADMPGSLSVHGDSLRLRLPAAWLEAHPLTRRDLDDECRMLREIGMSLELLGDAE